MRNNDSQLAGNPCRKNIRFRSGMVSGFPPGDTHVGFEMVDAPFHDGPDFIKGNPFIRIPLDARKHTEVHVFVSIGGVSFLAVLHGASQSQTHCPFTMWTFGQTHLLRSERPFSWQCSAYFMSRVLSLGRWDSRKGYSRLFQENFRFSGCKGSVPWKNGIHP